MGDGKAETRVGSCPKLKLSVCQKHVVEQGAGQGEIKEKGKGEAPSNALPPLRSLLLERWSS